VYLDHWKSLVLPFDFKVKLIFVHITIIMKTPNLPFTGTVGLYLIFFFLSDEFGPKEYSTKVVEFFQAKTGTPSQKATVSTGNDSTQILMLRIIFCL
jgi:hypothetical protein